MLWDVFEAFRVLIEGILLSENASAPVPFLDNVSEPLWSGNIHGINSRRNSRHSITVSERLADRGRGNPLLRPCFICLCPRVLYSPVTARKGGG
jgi:hypothetical protein